MTRKEKALDYFSRGFHCSQAVLASCADLCSLTEEQALKLGACFGSGMRKGEVCGACSGALMVLGSLYGQHDISDTESRQAANEVNDAMMRGFAEACGSYVCNDILGCDVSTPEEAKDNDAVQDLLTNGFVRELDINGTPIQAAVKVL